MAEQPLAGPAPAPALVFTAREPSELLKQRYGENEEFFEVSYIPPSLAGAFAGGYKDTDIQNGLTPRELQNMGLSGPAGSSGRSEFSFGQVGCERFIYRSDSNGGLYGYFE